MARTKQDAKAILRAAVLAIPHCTDACELPPGAVYDVAAAFADLSYGRPEFGEDFVNIGRKFRIQIVRSASGQFELHAHWSHGTLEEWLHFTQHLATALTNASSGGAAAAAGGAAGGAAADA